MSRRQTFPPVTLRGLIQEGRVVWLYSRKCGREKEVKPQELPLDPKDPVK
ncbi:MAG: hypothetical protein RIC14_07665 [Filomicrobium sp.]